MSSATLLVEGATLWVRKNQGDSAHLHSLAGNGKHFQDLPSEWGRLIHSDRGKGKGG